MSCSLAFIPVFVSYENQRGQAEAWRLASPVFNVLLVSLTALVLLAELLAPRFVTGLLVPGLPPDIQALTITLTRILLLPPLILGPGKRCGSDAFYWQKLTDYSRVAYRSFSSTRNNWMPSRMLCNDGL